MRVLVSAYAASREAWDVFAVKIVSRKDDISSWVRGTLEEVEDFEIMTGARGGETGCGIL